MFKFLGVLAALAGLTDYTGRFEKAPPITGSRRPPKNRKTNSKSRHWKGEPTRRPPWPCTKWTLFKLHHPKAK